MERDPLHHEGTWVDPAPKRGTAGHAPGLVLVNDDREWIDRIRGGDGGALEALFHQHARSLTAFAHRYVQSVLAAQEVAQEVFVRLWQGRHSWAFHGTVRGYLFASAHRVSLETLRRMHREARWHAGLPPDESLIVRGEPRAVGEPVSAAELEASVAVGIVRLPARARTAAFMRWSDRLTREEIATVLGSNARTVHSQLTPASWAMLKRLSSPDDIVDAWSTAASTREVSDGLDPLAGIDPDRLEEYLAGECLPADAAALQDDVLASGGEPAALDAMRMAWLRPGRAVEALVDQETAWRAMARRIALPVGPGSADRTWMERLTQTGRPVRAVVVSAGARVIDMSSRGAHRFGQWLLVFVRRSLEAMTRSIAWIGEHVSGWERRRYAHAAGEPELGRLPHIPPEDELWSDPAPRHRPPVVAFVLVGLAILASVWLYVARRAAPAAPRAAPTATAVPGRLPRGPSVEGGPVPPSPRGAAERPSRPEGRRHPHPQRVAPLLGPLDSSPRPAP